MNVTVCQLPDPPEGFEESWESLSAHTRENGSELVLLPEMIFHPWVAWTDEVDSSEWEAAVESHEKWLERLYELDVPIVAGSRPVTTSDGVRHNQAFVWHDGTVQDGHVKYYLPDEPGFWEATWYQPGDGSFEPEPVGDLTAGFMICTDMWFTEHARGYARGGAHFILAPRATEASTRDKWLAGGRAAAVMSGAYCLSSNREGESNGVSYAGMGWIIDPDGLVLARTSSETPFATVDIDPEVALKAKETYPRYVKE
ncbi:MAG: carbon-nitrogen hydrolase family protein [Acidimicrobiia bacterium]|nr:carbon-nitrogen hydrolase family protein [Acidimicrobiia bacterium]